MEITLAILSIIFTCLVFICARWAIRRHKVHQTLERYGIPGPKPDLFGGSLFQLRKHSNPNVILDSWIKKYGNVFGYYMGEDIYIVVKDLELLKKVFIKDFSSFTNRPKFLMETEPFPKMLIALRGKHWKDVRSLMTPAFTSGKLKFMTDMVSKKVDLTVDFVMAKANKNEIFNIHAFTQALTLDVIAGCALAMKKNIQENQNDDLLQAVRDTFKHQYNPIAELSTLFPGLSKVLHSFDDLFMFKKSLNTISNHLKNVIKERRQNPNLKSWDILQSLLDNCDDNSGESGKKLTEEEVVANALVTLLAGYNTTANALAFTFYLLAKYPEIQERLYQEILQAGDSSYTTLQNLTYLDQVFNESLRLYPVVALFISRICDTEYDIGSYTLPKGSTVLAPIWNIHHDPDLWPDPWKFDPDRFDPNNKDSIKTMSFFPFGAGPRNCAGVRFAQLEAKLAIFKILQKVKLETCEKTDDPLSVVCVAFTIFPANGVWIKAKLRNNA